ncbi:hypothetical protein F4802DRAFT_593748 [Xylaria palmicola]|nr:hypothetical protein F4802DRAFT_593748 [Xylaria palmicola]
MKLSTAFAIFAGLVHGHITSRDVSFMEDGVYSIPLADDGSIDYANAIKLNITRTYRPRRVFPIYGFKSTEATARADGDEDEDDDYDEDEDDKEDFDDGDEDHDQNNSVVGSMGSKTNYPWWSKGHCHWHYPHHNNRFLQGHELLNLTNVYLAMSNFMDWMTTGPDKGWLKRGEIRMSKHEDVVVGACIWKRKRLLTCIHELSLAFQAADYECAVGKVGCHACIHHWHKDYFRFPASEAPVQCECAWKIAN